MSQRITLFSSAFFSLAISIALIYFLRSEGILEPYELNLLDRFFIERQEQSVSEEIVLVTITENDLKELEQYPLSDLKLAQVLETIIAAQPRVIGLDLIRNFEVFDQNLPSSENKLAFEKLQTIFSQTNNLYGIAKITDAPDFPSIPGARTLEQVGRLAAADLVLDKDGVARRGNLYPDYNQANTKGLGLATALEYLKKEEIYPQSASIQKSKICPLPKNQKDSSKNYVQSGWIQLGANVLCPLTPRFGGYATHSDSGYQILINWSSCKGSRFSQINLGDILDNSFNPELLKDQLVFIGNISLSSNDLFLTPCSRNTGNTPLLMPGVEIQANLAQHIIGMGKGITMPLHSWNETGEMFWIGAWAVCLQILLFSFFRLKGRFFGLFSVTVAVIFFFSLFSFDLYFFLSRGLWLPLIPGWLCFVVQLLLTLVSFSWYRSKQNQDALELQVKERTKSLQQAFANLKQVQEKLIAQGKLSFLGKNTVYLSHEIRNPLGIIELANLVSKGLIQELARQEPSSQQQPTFTKMLDNSHEIEQSLERINRIIVLLNEHIKSDERPAYECNLNEVTEEALEITIYSFGIRHNWTERVELHTDYDSNLTKIQLYRSEFERALCNLIDNSLYSLMQKKTKNPDFLPRLSITTKLLNEQVQVIIEDNGEGIKPEEENKVFEEFYSNKGLEGTGLGLFIVKQIIEGKHDGSLRLETEWGEFARIMITLPLSKKD